MGNLAASKADSVCSPVIIQEIFINHHQFLVQQGFDRIRLSRAHGIKQRKRMGHATAVGKVVIGIAEGFPGSVFKQACSLMEKSG